MGADLSLLAHTAPSIAISSYVDVLEEVHYVSQLNSSRFLKTCKALDPHGEVIIKVFIKPTDDYNLEQVVRSVQTQTSKLADIPCVLNYGKILETDRAGYLIRQHLRRNLYDRLSSRPFLELIELKFMVFQFLQALKAIHSVDVVHGDLKTENLMLTSWNWLVLTDFSSFLKPTYLPEDNPGEFSFYFDTSQRRSCYIAPERFNTKLYKEGKRSRTLPSQKMDIFSAGCCIAELFSEGYSIFDLSQLFKYKTGEYDPREFLDRHLENDQIQNLVLSMIALNPKNRPSAADLLERYRGNLFPESFYKFFYDYVKDLTIVASGILPKTRQSEMQALNGRAQDIDKMVEKIYGDFGKICATLHYPLEIVSKPIPPSRLFGNFLNIPSTGVIALQPFNPDVESSASESALLHISLLSHAMRNVVKLRTRLRCLELLAAFSLFVSDANKLDRVVPFIISMFNDNTQAIQGQAIHVLTQVLGTVTKPTSLNANVFTDYILPRFKKLLHVSKNNTYVRMLFAADLGEICRAASKFQKAGYLSKENDQLNGSAGIQHRRLIKDFEEIIVALLTDNETNVRMALLSDLLPICHLFGREKTNDIILSHMITYLNDKNSSLRRMLIETITSVAILMGPITLDQYILPLLVQTITDSEELVVTSVLQSITALCKVGLIRKKYFLDIAEIVSTLLLHPNAWIRQFSLLFLIEISQKLHIAEVYCLLYPIIKPFFDTEVELTWECMLSSCKKPISRAVYNLLCTWSLRAGNSFFWRQEPTKKMDAFGNPNIIFISKDSSSKNYGLNRGNAELRGIRKHAENHDYLLTNEDKNWIEKLKTVGLVEGEFWKIAAMRPYVYRVSRMIARRPDVTASQNETTDFNLSELAIGPSVSNKLPQNVFFDAVFPLSSDSAKESAHLILKKKLQSTPSPAPNSTSAALSRPVEAHGSLILASRATSTITSCLNNIYVQLEPSSLSRANGNNTSLIDPKYNGEERYIMKSSYEGSNKYVKTFLNSIPILPALKEYPEFSSSYLGARRDFSQLTIDGGFSLSGKFLASCLVGQRTSAIKGLISLESSFVSGTDQGMIELWDLDQICSGKSFSSAQSLDLGSSITDLQLLEGFNIFVVSLRDGRVLVVKIITKRAQKLDDKPDFEVIRSFNLPEKSTYAIKLTVNADEKNQWITLFTNTSNMLILDLRTMGVIKKFENNAAHGAVITGALSDDLVCLAVGTSKGFIDAWDVRFGVMVHSWTFADSAPVTQLEFCPPIFKKSERNLIVIGGSSHTLFSIWDYSKLVCRHICSSSSVPPVIDDFVATKEPRINQENEEPQATGSGVSTLLVLGRNIFISQTNTSEILAFNLKEKAVKHIGQGTSGSDIVLETTQLTANISIFNLRDAGAGTTSSKKVQNRFHADLVNGLSLITKDQGQYLISADNSGMINIFS
ncbi:LAMI_0E09604g1_1 [Lachancea mirantina]|uniref:non-specific serine/threonine protein kinase n=1 Tax=Lachancea mirantina TaxID=1230905 RepID=A0A1G4JNK8_9SACH|nr:LAMI_0E09604g1_1 [Lachancea mirantina]